MSGEAKEKEPEKPPTTDQDRWDGAATALIVATTIIATVLAWRAATNAGDAGASDNAGLRSVTWAQTSKTTHTIDAYEDYRMFLRYRVNSELGDYIEGSVEDATAEETTALNHELEEARQVAEINISFLDESQSSRYLSRDGTYAVQRELGEKWAAASGRYDMTPEPHFARADKYREIKQAQLRAGILLTMALLFYTLFRVLGGKLQFVCFFIGVLLTFSGTIWAILLERLS